MVNGNNKVHKMRQERALKVQCRELCYVVKVLEILTSSSYFVLSILHFLERKVSRSIYVILSLG